MYPAYEVQQNQDTSTHTNNMLSKSDLKKINQTAPDIFAKSIERC